MANPHGHARVDARNPQAFAVCDRCRFLYNHVDLSYQYEWNGDVLMNTNFLVCDRCYDTPNQLNRPIILPPDPVPIDDPRPEYYDLEVEGDYLSILTEGGVPFVTEGELVDLELEGSA